MTAWKLVKESYSRAGKRQSRMVHTRTKVPRSFYRKRVTILKKRMIRYQYSQSGTKLDYTTKWMKAPLKYAKTHRKKGSRR